MAAVETGPSAPEVQGGFVDTTLIDALAPLTPEERLRWNDRVATAVMELRHGFAAAEHDDVARAAGGERD
jgi:hypothetical protein